MSARSANVVATLGLLVMLPGCAAHRYMPGPQLSRARAPEQTVTVWIVGDGTRGCMKDPKRPVATLYGQGKDRLTWNIINGCRVDGKPKTVIISIEDVRVKHRPKIFGAGKPPFANPRPVTVAPNSEADPYPLTADVFSDAPDEEYRGLNVYSYGFTIKAENGPTRKHDPEILIDWP